MTLVNQDVVLEQARTMGEFSTMQMAFRVYGSIDSTHVSAARHKLLKLCRRGYVERLGKRKDQHSCQFQMYWRAV